ncbi:hypothetical protein [Acinetobacter modestus]|uniref:hypothetical protein n=1 Tax=Acinetobacter modestus TaxID=1776740 RepID=UPI00301995F0
MSLVSAKQLIWDAMGRDAIVGSYCDQRYIMIQAVKRGITRQEMQDAFDSIIKCGYLTNEGKLTELGFSYLYPSNVPYIKQRLIDAIKAQNLRVNDIVSPAVLNTNLIMHLNTQERKDLEVAFQELLQENILEPDEKRLRLKRSV